MNEENSLLEPSTAEEYLKEYSDMYIHVVGNTVKSQYSPTPMSIPASVCIFVDPTTIPDNLIVADDRTPVKPGTSAINIFMFKEFRSHKERYRFLEEVGMELGSKNVKVHGVAVACPVAFANLPDDIPEDQEEQYARENNLIEGAFAFLASSTKDDNYALSVWGITYDEEGNSMFDINRGPLVEGSGEDILPLIDERLVDSVMFGWKYKYYGASSASDFLA